MSIWNALIRTHHITSRKKVAHLKKAADRCHVFALLRSGGCPGIMYCEGDEEGVKSWVAAVQNLRYKDFQLVARPASKSTVAESSDRNKCGLSEVESVKSFSMAMESRDCLQWWRHAMGY
ncbi:hypothetical protein K402DRAFT_298123, partial [Aulographum hederae CBS 113979]